MGKTIYDYPELIEQEHNINYIKLNWDLKELEDRQKEGAFIMDLVKKEVKWVSNLSSVIKYVNKGKDFFDEGYTPSNQVSHKLSVSSEEKVVNGLYVCLAFDFDKDKAGRNYKLVPAPIENSDGKVFDNIEDAADYIKNEGISSASTKVIVNSLRKNLTGKTKKSYGKTWYFSSNKRAGSSVG